MNNLIQLLQQTQYNMPTTPLEPLVPQSATSPKQVFGVYPLHPVLWKLRDEQITLLSDLLESGAISIKTNPGLTPLKLFEAASLANEFMANKPLVALLEQVAQAAKCESLARPAASPADQQKPIQPRADAPQEHPSEPAPVDAGQVPTGGTQSEALQPRDPSEPPVGSTKQPLQIPNHSWTDEQLNLMALELLKPLNLMPVSTACHVLKQAQFFLRACTVFDFTKPDFQRAAEGFRLAAEQ
jgi:hypothetical protein